MAEKTFRFESSDPARDRARFFSELRAFGESCDWSQPISNEIQLILEEWWTNLVSYAFAKSAQPSVIVEITSTEGEARIQVTDNGIPFDPAARTDPDLHLPVEERPIGGLGIYMMKKLSKSLRSGRDGERNVLRIAKDLTSPVLRAKS